MTTKRKKNNKTAPKGGQHSTTKRKRKNKLAPLWGPALDNEKKREKRASWDLAYFHAMLLTFLGSILAELH